MTLEVNRIHHGDWVGVMKGWDADCVDCVVTSPPYWGLRKYGDWRMVTLWGDLSTFTMPRNAKKRRSWLIRKKIAADRKGIVWDREKKSHFCALGLEPTPELFVEHIVEGFAEVKRVLADHGTLWLNLGDSYAGGKMGRADSGDNGKFAGPEMVFKQNIVPLGLKPKDLCGIPWRVAFALQQPYYTGTIKDERDRIWLAAMIDTEGCMFIHKRKVGQSNGQGYKRKNDNYAPGLEIANTSKEIVDRCMAIVGKGSICSQSPEQNKRRKQTIYRWNLRTTECRDIVREIYPHLTAKHHQARILCGCPSSGPDADAAHQSLMALHNGNKATIDFPAPASMFEQGWYLRQDIIWKKPNPMPESCRDRCTKAHEYVFLLTKKPRYYYDQEAVREPQSENSHARYAAGETPPPAKPDSKELARPGYEQWRETTPDHILPNGRNRRSVWTMSFDEWAELWFEARDFGDTWTIPTQAYSEAHFATFPEKLVEPCIKAGCPKEVCTVCRKPRERIVEKPKPPEDCYTKSNLPTDGLIHSGQRRDGIFRGSGQKVQNWSDEHPVKTTGWTDCGCGSYHPGRVLDPFMGSGTVGVVAHEHGRAWVGIELSEEYIELAERRIGRQTEKYGLLDPLNRGC